MSQNPAQFNPFGPSPTSPSGVDITLIKADWDQRSAYLSDILPPMLRKHYEALLEEGLPESLAAQLTTALQDAWIFEYFSDSRPTPFDPDDEDDDEDDDNEGWKKE